MYGQTVCKVVVVAGARLCKAPGAKPLTCAQLNQGTSLECDREPVRDPRTGEAWLHVLRVDGVERDGYIRVTDVRDCGDLKEPQLRP